MMPLLYHHLNATCPDMVTEPTLRQLEDYFFGNAGRNLFLTNELLRLLKLFETHGVSVLPFKGPVLAASAYGNLALREFTDLDILVHERDAPAARKLLASQGYQPLTPMTEPQEAASRAFRYDCQLMSADGRVMVELHWQVSQWYFAFPIDSDRLWDRMGTVSLAGSTVSTLAPEDLLLILCAHATKHGWERLAWVCDVAEVIRAYPEMAWETVWEQAGKLGSRRVLSLGLILARDLAGAALTEEVRQRVQADPTAGTLAAQVRQQLFQEADRPSGILARCLFLFANSAGLTPSRIRFHLRAKERLRDRVRYCFRLAVESTFVFLERRVPAGLTLLYYLPGGTRKRTALLWLVPVALISFFGYLLWLVPKYLLSRFGAGERFLHLPQPETRLEAAAPERDVKPQVE